MFTYTEDGDHPGPDHRDAVLVPAFLHGVDLGVAVRYPGLDHLLGGIKDPRVVSVLEGGAESSGKNSES